MKKIFSILLVFIIIFSFVGCSNKSIDDKILYTSKAYLKGFTATEDTFYIDTYSDKYVVNIEHDTQQITATYLWDSNNGNSNKFTWANIQEITSSDILKTIASSKELFINFINETSLLKDKEALISYINNLPLKSADFPNNSLIAAFDPNHDTVFVNINSNSVDTHTIVHEFFHALASKTRDNSNWYDYCTTIFDEAFTELLTTSIVESSYPTIYDEYIKYVYYFIGSHGIDAIKIYFYGLEDVQIPTTEFHLYTMSVDVLSNAKTTEEVNGEKAILHLILSTWIKNK